MGVFGAFVFGGDLYGSDADLQGAVVVTSKLVKVLFDIPVVVDAAYLSPSSYTVTVIEGTGPVAVRGVVVPTALTASSTLLEIDAMTAGTLYEVSSTDLSSTVGSDVVGTARFVGRRTKAETLLKTLPRHFDPRPAALITGLGMAMGMSDDLIGGSRSDSLL